MHISHNYFNNMSLTKPLEVGNVCRSYNIIWCTTLVFTFWISLFQLEFEFVYVFLTVKDVDKSDIIFKAYTHLRGSEDIIK